MVQLTFDNNVLRRRFSLKSHTAPLDRMMDLFKTISAKEALDFDIKKGKATNTVFFRKSSF